MPKGSVLNFAHTLLLMWRSESRRRLEEIMPAISPQVLTVIVGTSSFLGLTSLIAYLYFVFLSRRAERSIRDVIHGETLFNAEQVLSILSQFRDDSSRLEALRTLTDYDTAKARDLLVKIKGNVDVSTVSRISAKNYHRIAITLAVLFLALTAMALFYKIYINKLGPPIVDLIGGTPVENVSSAGLEGTAWTGWVAGDDYNAKATMRFARYGNRVTVKLEIEHVLPQGEFTVTSPESDTILFNDGDLDWTLHRVGNTLRGNVIEHSSSLARAKAQFQLSR